jgi:LPS-assembly lipoprotein
MRRLLAAWVGLGLCLSGCGFEPLYASHNGAESAVVNDTALVQIAPIPDRLGQDVRNHLLDSLNPRGEPGNPSHRLEVRLELSEEGVALRTDEATTRYNVRLIAYYRLVETMTGKVVFENRARGFVAYDVVRSQFATLSAQQDAESRAAQEVAEDISGRVALFFTKKP